MAFRDGSSKLEFDVKDLYELRQYGLIKSLQKSLPCLATYTHHGLNFRRLKDYQTGFFILTNISIHGWFGAKIQGVHFTAEGKISAKFEKILRHCSMMLVWEPKKYFTEEINFRSIPFKQYFGTPLKHLEWYYKGKSVLAKDILSMKRDEFKQNISAYLPCWACWKSPGRQHSGQCVLEKIYRVNGMVHIRGSWVITRIEDPRFVPFKIAVSPSTIIRFGIKPMDYDKIVDDVKHGRTEEYDFREGMEFPEKTVVMLRL
jgi:hypothetical protein